jgi:hypothetical protein
MVEDLKRPSARTRWARSRFLGLLIVAGLLGGGFLLPRPGPSSVRAQEAASPSARDADAILAERTGDCEVCRRMANDILPGEFVHDAHEIPCADCHHPHVKRTDDQWKRKCYDCHPRAWTESIMHRLDVEVFRVCTNCHVPHEFSADGADCMSCHGDGPEGAVTVGAFTDAVAFDHDSHVDLDCATCHASIDRHANLVLTSSADCAACHHDPSAARECGTCHDSGTMTAALPVEFTNSFARGADPRTRTMSFDHSDHADRACAECHATDGSNRVVTDCASCHTEHHPVEAECATCHPTPSADVHPFEAHWSGCEDSGCHAGSGLAMPTENRNWCVSCHRDQDDHYPEAGACVTCHLPPEGMP